jgi:putative membrane protein
VNYVERNYDRKFPTTIIAIIAIAIAVAVILMAVLAYFGSRNSYGYNGYYGGMMGGSGGFGMLFMIPIGLIVLLIIGYVIWRGCGWGGGGCGGDHSGHYSSDAMEILHQRYARGEISKDQFEQMKKDIVV